MIMYRFTSAWKKNKIPQNIQVSAAYELANVVNPLNYELTTLTNSYCNSTRKFTLNMAYTESLKAAQHVVKQNGRCHHSQ